MQAAGALASISSNNDENEQAIAKMLVDLLRNSTASEKANPKGTGAPEKAARGISRLARANASNQNAVASAGGIPLLVELLDEGVRAQQWIEARRASAEEREGASDGSRADSPSFSKSDGAAARGGHRRRASTADREALPPPSPDMRPVEVAFDEEGELAPVSSESPPIGNNDADLRRMTIAAAPKEMAGAIWSMAHENADNQAALAQAGAISPLIEMLRGEPSGYRDAAGALWALAADESTQLLIANANAIGPLVAILNARGPALEAHETAAGALGVLARTAKIRSTIAEAGAIVPLVELFNMQSMEAKVQASAALLTLVIQNEANQLSIAAGLVRIFTTSHSVDAHEQACDLCKKLSEDADNRGALARAGAIPQLVKQLKTSTGMGHLNAAAALSNIALKSAELRVQVTQQLVKLLADDSEEVRQRAGVAVRQMSSEGGDDSQRAVAMAGGVAPLVALLQDGLQDGMVEAQEYAL